MNMELTTRRVLTWLALVLFVHVSMIETYFDQNVNNDKIGQTQADIDSILRGYARILNAELKSKASKATNIREHREKIVIWNEKHLALEKNRQKSEFEIPVLGVKIPRSTMIVFYPFMILSGLVYVSISRRAWMKENTVAGENTPFWAYPLRETGGFLQNNLAILFHGVPIIWLVKFLLDIYSKSPEDGEKFALVFLLIGSATAIYIQSFFRKKEPPNG